MFEAEGRAIRDETKPKEKQTKGVSAEKWEAKWKLVMKRRVEL